MAIVKSYIFHLPKTPKATETIIPMFVGQRSRSVKVDISLPLKVDSPSSLKPQRVVFRSTIYMSKKYFSQLPFLLLLLLWWYVKMIGWYMEIVIQLCDAFIVVQ